MEKIMSRASACVAAALFCTVATPIPAQIADFKPVTREMLVSPDPADWLMLNRTYDEQRFSPLNQVNRENVGQLELAWARSRPGPMKPFRSCTGA